MAWAKLDGLGDRDLFVGRNCCSMSFSARQKFGSLWTASGAREYSSYPGPATSSFRTWWAPQPLSHHEKVTPKRGNANLIGFQHLYGGIVKGIPPKISGSQGKHSCWNFISVFLNYCCWSMYFVMKNLGHFITVITSKFPFEISRILFPSFLTMQYVILATSSNHAYYC